MFDVAKMKCPNCSSDAAATIKANSSAVAVSTESPSDHRSDYYCSFAPLSLVLFFISFPLSHIHITSKVVY